jgi:hypothetical protein
MSITIVFVELGTLLDLGTWEQPAAPQIGASVDLGGFEYLICAVRHVNAMTARAICRKYEFKLPSAPEDDRPLLKGV